MAEVEQADPRTRRFALAYLVAAAVLGGAALFFLDSHRQSLLSWFLARAPHVQVSIIVGALFLLTAPLLVMAAWMWKYGVRVLRTNRHPPEGVRLIRDTPVTRGAAARLYGRFYQALALAFVLATLLILWISWALWRLR